MNIPDCLPRDDGTCALCGDAAHPAVVLSVDPAARLAAVDLAGVRTEVALDLVGAVRAGDRVLVHQGFALSRLETP